ncbi:hypothetical protein FH972_022582 [Carpinus fangiana]|uniref:C2H2-type domain-containing protein n=1 Tax=Carpinus fangiana TaxID=176857 RepID=A0A5N6KT25_9ROSI|nr:hypothetical protein FH972_022582 [Carpinus fangiana]
MTAFVPPNQAVFDSQFPFGNPYDQQSRDHTSYEPLSASTPHDETSFDSLWPLNHPRTQPALAPPHHRDLFEEPMHSSYPQPAHALANASCTASVASASAPSTNSSVRGSPQAFDPMANSSFAMPMAFDHTFAMTMPDGSMPDFSSVDEGGRLSSFVDPALLLPVSNPNPKISVPLSNQSTASSSNRPSTLKHNHSADSSRSGSQPFKISRSNSPYLQPAQSAWQPYPQSAEARRISSNSFGGGAGNGSTRGSSSEAEDRDKGRCPFPECGKVFKDLKAHMLTHQNERPEKCPIPSCDYNKKGFSRKYDKNRHTLTHYKGTMICGFCPGSGSAAEKSFNRADVFKRHLTTVHHVEQAPPNSRKKQAGGASSKKDVGNASGTTGKCSICSQIFQTPQDFYEHLEDCVLDVVQKVDPGEAINEALLASMDDDKDTNDTIKRHATTESNGVRDGDGESEEEADDHEHKSALSTPTSANAQAASDSKTSSRGAGVTYSSSGIPFHKQPRKRRKNYPNSWGCSADKMKMKKRVLTVFDGRNRLVKDDLMMSSDFEVRMKLNLPQQPGQPGAGDPNDSNAYVTDLDVETLRRAEGFFQATEDERGPWRWTNVPGGENLAGNVDVDLEALMA